MFTSIDSINDHFRVAVASCMLFDGVTVNIHHLELFYYVAKFGGISRAVRNMPYGIQQPAVSSQLIKLEASLGVALFRRRPFGLTPAGDELYQFIAPFFDNLDSVATKLRGGTVRHIAIGASEIVLREHLPAIVKSVREQFPHLKMTLREGYQSKVATWLEKEEIELAFTLLEQKCPAGFNYMPILDLPLILIAPRRSRLKAAADLWGLDKIEEALITLPAYEAMCKNFQAGLTRKKVDWFPSIEVSSLELIETYVMNGYGIGLFLDIPGVKLSPQLRALPLVDFEPVHFGAVWRGKANPVVEAFIESTRVRALSILGECPPPGAAVGDSP